MALDEHEVNTLNNLYNDICEHQRRYSELSNTGNSQGEHKKYYKAKSEAYLYCKRKLENYMSWHSIPYKK